MRFLLLSWSLLTAFPTGATIYYVGTTGNDNNSGTSWASAFAFLQKAVTVAGNGDSIFIAKGDYVQTEITGFTKNLSIYGSFEGWENSPAQRSFADSTILDGNGNPQNIAPIPAGIILFISGNKSKVLLNGLKIANGVNYDNQNAFGTGGGVFIEGDSVWIDRCTLFNNGAYNGSAIGQPGGYLVLTRSIIANNFHSGSLVVSAGSTVVNECQFNNNEAGGVDFQGQNLVVTNTQIVFNRGHFMKGAINVEAGKATLANNTFYMDSVYPLGANGSVLQVYSGCNVTFQNNIVWACLTTVISNQGTLNETYNIGQGMNTAVTGSMGFADSTQPFNGGLALTAASPAVNDGDSAGVSAYLGDSDLAGNARFQGCRIDQGAFESALSGLIQMRAQPVGDTICPGSEAMMLVSATGDAPVFQWQSQSGGGVWANVAGATDTSLSATAASTYRCIITGTGNCNTADTSAVAVLSVEVLPLITSQPGDDTVCAGGNALYSIGVSGTHPLIQWQTGSGAIIGSKDSLILSPVDSDGVYRCIISDSLGCGKRDTSVTALLKVNNGPEPFTLGKDTTLCRGDSLALAVQPVDSGVNYSWQDGSGHPYFEVVSPGTYTVQASNSCGSLDGTIGVAYQTCACAFYIPNAFSPNGDGRNDLFKPQYQCLFDHYLMKVFNRWGQVVFMSRAVDNGWDGTAQGIAQPVGAYAWEISYEDIMGGHMIVRQGTVVLMR